MADPVASFLEREQGILGELEGLFLGFIYEF